MTLLKRLTLIGLAALLVVGAALAWSQLNPSAGGAERQPPAGFNLAEAGAALGATSGQPAAGEGLRGDHAAAGGLPAAGEILKNVLIVGALTGAVAGASRLTDAIRSRRRAPPSAA